MRVINPYESAFDLPWFKGDIHFHSDASDGRNSPEEMMARLRECGFDFAAPADHDIYRPGDDSHDPVLLGNSEIYTPGADILSLFAEIDLPGERAEQEIIDLVAGAGGLPVIAHPKIGEFNKAKAGRTMSSQRLAGELTGYFGLEVYTHNLGSGFQAALDRFDAVWTRRRLAGGDDAAPSGPWCFATSDAHDTSRISPDVGIMVAASSCNGRALRQAIKKGRFYSIGDSKARFREISLEAERLKVVVEGARLVRLFGLAAPNRPGDRRCLALAWGDGRAPLALDYRLVGAEGFIRAEALDERGCFACANPLTIIPDR